MQYLTGQRGMTFVEMIVVLSIFAILSVAVLTAIASFYQYNAYTIAQAYQVNNARRGVEFLVRDLREMTFADDGAFPLISKSTHDISFYSDIDRDDSVEYIEYELISSTTLHKRVYNATGTPPVYNLSTPDNDFILSEYVQNIVQGTSTFSYYDTNGEPATATTTVIDVRYVQAQIIVNIDPIRDPGQYMLRSSAALRNLKESL